MSPDGLEHRAFSSTPAETGWKPAAGSAARPLAARRRARRDAGGTLARRSGVLRGVIAIEIVLSRRLSTSPRARATRLLVATGERVRRVDDKHASSRSPCRALGVRWGTARPAAPPYASTRRPRRDRARDRVPAFPAACETTADVASNDDREVLLPPFSRSQRHGRHALEARHDGQQST